MKIYRKKIKIESKGQIEFTDITKDVQEIVEKSKIKEGQVLVYSPHTSAGIIVNHNEPMLLQDFMRVLYRLIPLTDRYSHDLFELKKNQLSDGRSNGHAHCKTMLLGISENIPLENGEMMITDRQNIFLAEMDGARTREIIVQVMGT